MDFGNNFFNLLYKKLVQIKTLIANGNGGGGTVDQTAREMAQAAQNAAANKADKIVQQVQVPQTMFDYFHQPVPTILELPAGTTHTTSITEADIQELQPYIIITGITPANPARIRFSSVSGDFYIEYRAVPGRRPNVDGLLAILQKQPDGSFSGVSIYNGPIQGGGNINNITVTQIDWLSFSNYDMAFLIQNMNITLAEVRELNIWKKIMRSALVETTKDLADVRNDVMGELVASVNTFNDLKVNGIPKQDNNIEISKKIPMDDLNYLMDNPDEATPGMIYMVDDGAGAMRMYIKDGNVMKELGGGGAAAIMALITDLQARLDALENP